MPLDVMQRIQYHHPRSNWHSVLLRAATFAIATEHFQNCIRHSDYLPCKIESLDFQLPGYQFIHLSSSLHVHPAGPREKTTFSVTCPQLRPVSTRPASP